jgi:hypothetical protein
MFNRTHMAAIALAGALSAAALTPAMAFTPPHNTINVGPPAHVNIPTPGPSPKQMNGATGRSHFEGVPGDRKGNDPNWHSVDKAPTPPKDAGKPGGV